MILKKTYLILLFFLIKPLFSFSQEPILGAEVVGIASYYGTKFYGHKTASGELLKKEDLTCAHPTFPFGTMLEVTNLSNNKWCVVRVNDRGPFSRSRVLDVSHEAAARLGMFSSGVSKVKVMVVGDNNNVIITRPEAIIENSMELVSNSETIILPPLKQEKIKQTKKVVKAKGKKRRK
jgi:rare lipoprotein A